ncbi:hypothetical protein Tco_0655100, partial [Tanacetum coccineum]
LQAKDTIISKLKETIDSLTENANPAKVKKDIDEIETINIESKHSVAKLLDENEKFENSNSRKGFANATLKNKLRKLKGKNVIDTVVSKPYAITMAPGMFKLNLEPLASKVLKNKDAHLEYIKHFREHANILREIVKSARALSPLDSNLDYALTVTSKNKDKKVRSDPVTSSSNTQKQVDSHKPKDSNQPLLHSTGVISSTSASRSKPIGNTKNNMISQSSSSNKTNKLKDQSRSVKSRKNKKNHVSKTECNAYVMQSMLNVNSKYVCAICNECLFYYVHDVNVLSKSKPAKLKTKKQIWKPTGKVYIEIGYKWKPTRRTFTIVGIKCPLTSRRPKATNSVVQIVLWYMDSGCSKLITGNRSQVTNFVNKFLGTVKFGNDQIAKIMGYDDYQIRNVTISRVYYVEGLRHNLFSVSQFCDSNLEVAFRKHTCFVRNLEGVPTHGISGSKDEASSFIIKFLKMIQVRLNATVRNIRTDNQAVATTCYTHNRSLICLCHEKKPYELLHDRKSDLSYLHVFCALCYPTNDSEDLGKLKAKADVAMASEQSSLGPALREMNPRTLSSGLMPQPPSSTPFVPSIRDDWDTLLQPLFDEYFHPSPCVDHLVPEVAALVFAVSTASPSSTSVDQDAPSPKADHDIEVAHMDNNPQFGILIPEPSSEESSSQSHGALDLGSQEKGYQDAAYGRSLNMLPVSNKEIAGSYKVVTAAIGRG